MARGEAGSHFTGAIGPAWQWTGEGPGPQTSSWPSLSLLNVNPTFKKNAAEIDHCDQEVNL